MPSSATPAYTSSILIADLGAVVYAIVNLLRLFAIAPNTLMAVLLALSWWGMVIPVKTEPPCSLPLPHYIEKNSRTSAAHWSG